MDLRVNQPGFLLNQKGKIDDNQSIEDYFMVTEIIDGLLDKSSRWPKAKDNIDDLMIVLDNFGKEYP